VVRKEFRSTGQPFKYAKVNLPKMRGMSPDRPERSVPSARECAASLKPGIYSCLCCETVLFDAPEKFESHTGWPSFTQPIKENVVATGWTAGVLQARRNHLQHLWRPPGPRLPRWPGPERSALVHECRGAAQIRRGRSGCRCVKPIVIRPALLHTKGLDRNRVPCFSTVPELCPNFIYSTC